MLEAVHQVGFTNLLLQLIITRGHRISRHKAVPISDTTSCYLNVAVLGKSISFLVDTGAGVLLLNGKVWDRIEPKNIKAVEFHNLVGVDGHPLQFMGQLNYCPSC